MSNKEIGQFFSGSLVADLLISAADVNNIGSIYAIDPMVGKADMLAALQKAGSKREHLFGVDIDRTAIKDAKGTIPDQNLLTADAFSAEAALLYQLHKWDLVITNPPYVRYQNLNTLYGNDPVNKVRKSLESIITALDDNGSKKYYLSAIRSYSGLADLAVPCWILCAYLVRPGGKLAMVLPDSWLKREYASALHKILSEDFTVDRVVLDESRLWFHDAQVKTCLLIATKNQTWGERSAGKAVRHIGLTKYAASSKSLVDKLEYEGLSGFNAFKRLCVNDDRFSDEKVWVRDELVFEQRTLEAKANSGCDRLATIRDWGINVGQGLRTGANSFFYFKKGADGFISNSIWREAVGDAHIEPGALPLIPAIRYQDELGQGYFVDALVPSYYLLRINDPVNFNKIEDENQAYNALARYINYCESHVISHNGREQYIPNLSAVRTNGPTSKFSEYDRYWYMLPNLKQRHLPDLIIPRINGGVVQTYLLPKGRSNVVDANFLTLWIDSGRQEDAYTVLALLNSTYVRLKLEKTCNVLGGGALKCEAISIRKLTLPIPNNELMGRLSALGSQLAKSKDPEALNKAQNSIDVEIARSMLVSGSADAVVGNWKSELNLRLKLRRE